MKVSICTSVFDRDSKVLQKVFCSIFDQKVPFEFEVIVCDDGSSNPKVKETCNSFLVKYLRIDRPPVRRNPCIARNTAYRAATGDIIIAQSDEVVHISPNCIETLVHELESHPKSFIIASVLACGPDDNPWSVYTGTWYRSKTDIQKRMKPFFFLGALWRKDLYSIGGNDEDFHNLQGYDDDWFALCLTEGLGLKPVYVDSVVGHHLYHTCSDTSARYAVARSFYNKKCAEAKRLNTWKASGGSWPYA